MLGTSRTGVIELDVVGSCVNQTMLNTEEHRESVYVSSMLNRLPSKTLDHVGDTSWCSFCVVMVDETGCSALLSPQRLQLLTILKVSEYDQEIPQSHTADQPTAP